MDSNTHSASPAEEALAALATMVDRLAARDLDGLADAVRAARVLELRPLLDRLEGQWLKELAGVEGRGAAGADQGCRLARPPVGCGPGCAWGPVPPGVVSGRPGPCSAAPDPDRPGGDQRGAVSGPCQRAGCWHPGPPRPGGGGGRTSPAGGGPAADPPRLGQAVGHLGAVIDPDTAAQADRHHQRRGLWLAATWDGMVAVEGRLEAEAGQSLLAAWNRWPARPTPTMGGVRGSGGLMPWPSWPGAAWRPAGCPGLVGSGPS